MLDDIGNEHRDRNFAIIIDEAHSSQGGRTAAKMNMALSQAGAEEDDEDTEDEINRIMEGAQDADRMPATSPSPPRPKNKTLEVFGEPYAEGDVVKHRPFHSYTMKQAIQEASSSTCWRTTRPYQSYYNLVKTIEDDPEFDAKRAQRSSSATSKGTSTPSARRPRSWSTTSTSR